MRQNLECHIRSYQSLNNFQACPPKKRWKDMSGGWTSNWLQVRHQQWGCFRFLQPLIPSRGIRWQGNTWKNRASLVHELINMGSYILTVLELFTLQGMRDQLFST
jgi:hypothetical protein